MLVSNRYAIFAISVNYRIGRYTLYTDTFSAVSAKWLTTGLPPHNSKIYLTNATCWQTRVDSKTGQGSEDRGRSLRWHTAVKPSPDNSPRLQTRILSPLIASMVITCMNKHSEQFCWSISYSKVTRQPTAWRWFTSQSPVTIGSSINLHQQTTLNNFAILDIDG